MPLFIDTRGNETLGIGICARCCFKFPLGELHPDPNSPGLLCCKKDLDQFDPYRLPPPQADIFNLPFTRPDAHIGLPEETPPLVPPKPPPGPNVLVTASGVPITTASGVEILV